MRNQVRSMGPFSKLELWSLLWNLLHTQRPYTPSTTPLNEKGLGRESPTGNLGG